MVTSLGLKSLFSSRPRTSSSLKVTRRRWLVVKGFLQHPHCIESFGGRISCTSELSWHWRDLGRLTQQVPQSSAASEAIPGNKGFVKLSLVWNPSVFMKMPFNWLGRVLVLCWGYLREREIAPLICSKLRHWQSRTSHPAAAQFGRSDWERLDQVGNHIQLTGNTIAGRNAPRRKARWRRKKITMQTTIKRHVKLQDWRSSIVMCAMITCLRSRGNLRPNIYSNKFSWSLGQEKKHSWTWQLHLSKSLGSACHPTQPPP